MFTEITENLDTHKATYSDGRAVKYVLTDNNGKQLASIVIDLIDASDYGMPQATSNMLAALLNAGRAITADYKVYKYLIG